MATAQLLLHSWEEVEVWGCKMGPNLHSCVASIVTVDLWACPCSQTVLLNYLITCNKNSTKVINFRLFPFLFCIIESWTALFWKIWALFSSHFFFTFLLCDFKWEKCCRNVDKGQSITHYGCRHFPYIQEALPFVVFHNMVNLILSELNDEWRAKGHWTAKNEEKFMNMAEVGGGQREAMKRRRISWIWDVVVKKVLVFYCFILRWSCVCVSVQHRTGCMVVWTVTCFCSTSPGSPTLWCSSLSQQDSHRYWRLRLWVRETHTHTHTHTHRFKQFIQKHMYTNPYISEFEWCRPLYNAP